MRVITNFFSAKNMLFLVLFVGLFVMSKQTIGQDCTDFYGPTGQPTQGLAINLCTGNPGFVTLNATATGTSAASAYTWSTGANTPISAVVTGGMYTVTISATGAPLACILNYVVTSHANPIPDLSTSDSIFCTGNQGVLRAPSGYVSYIWTGSTSSDDSLAITTAGQYFVTVTDVNTCVGEDSVSAFVNLVPVVNLGIGSSVCVGDSVVLSAGSGLDDYLWSTGDTNQTLVIETSGNYSVTVTDSNSCSGSDSYLLSNFTVPTVYIGADDTLCGGFTKILDAGAGFLKYQWSNGGAVQTATYGTTGDHWVSVEDANGCVASDTMHLEIKPAPVLNLGVDDTICASQGYNLNAGNPGNSIASYIWSTGSTNQTISIVADPTLGADISVDYVVTITDANGCLSADTLNLTTYTLPIPDLGSDTSFCQGSLFSMILNPGMFPSYAWSNGSTNATINIGATPNTYSVTVADARGCVNDDLITVIRNGLPNPNLGPDVSYCQASSFTKILNSGSFTSYLWNDGSSGQILGVSSAGTYGITVTDINGCENNDEVIITENPTPIVDLGIDVPYCEDDTVIHFIDATTQLPSNNFNFLWLNTGEVSGTIIATNFEVYTVVVTDNTSGCYASSSMEIIAMEKAMPDLGDDGIVCQGQLVKLDPGVKISGYNYTWSNGASTSTVNVFETGLYWVRLDATNGTCMDLTDTVYFSPGVLPVVNLGADQYVCDGQRVTLLNGSSPFPESTYEWQDGSVGKTYVATLSGNYEVEVTNECGSVVDQVFIEFQDCGNVYVPTSFTPNGDGRNEIFLPASDQEFNEYGFWVYDRWGSLLFKTNQPKLGWDGTVDGKIMTPGTYVWRISYVSSFQEFGLRIEKTGEFNLLR